MVRRKTLVRQATVKQRKEPCYYMVKYYHTDIKQVYGESAILYSRRCPSIFLQIGLKFISDREDFHVEMRPRLL